MQKGNSLQNTVKYRQDEYEDDEKWLGAIVILHPDCHTKSPGFDFSVHFYLFVCLCVPETRAPVVQAGLELAM